MARYLTSSKIGLLALISLYCDSVIPSTATIPVLSFLVSHLLPVTAVSSTKTPPTVDRSSRVTIEDFQKATIVLVSGIPGRTVWDLLLKKLWEINSLDALNVFFDGLSLLLEQTREEQQADAEEGVVPEANRIVLSRISPLGAFIRRAQLEFTRLQIYDCIMLWKTFLKYREPTLPLWRKRNPTAGKNTFDANLEDNHFSPEDRLTEVLYRDLDDSNRREAAISTDDVERLLEYQVDQMQSEPGKSLLQRLSALIPDFRTGQSATAGYERPNPNHGRDRCDGSQSFSLCRVHLDARHSQRML